MNFIRRTQKSHRLGAPRARFFIDSCREFCAIFERIPARCHAHPRRFPIRCALLCTIHSKLLPATFLEEFYFKLTLEPIMATFGLIEYQDASPEVRAIYDDIMATRKTDWINNFWKAI